MMKTIMISNEKIRYDRRHDVLHVFLGSPIHAFADEEYTGIYVSRNKFSHDIVEFTVLDYKMKKDFLQSLYPEYKFPEVCV